MAATMRSVLSDIFREAVEGHIEKPLSSPTRAAKVVVKRERLELAQYGPIRSQQSRCRSGSVWWIQHWSRGQRRDDLASDRR